MGASLLAKRISPEDRTSGRSGQTRPDTYDHAKSFASPPARPMHFTLASFPNGN